jgi:hypothetical protein
MKHIKTYTKLFESKFESPQNQWKRIEPILHDILLPLNDSYIDYVMYMVGRKTYDGEIKIFIEDTVEEFTEDGLKVSKKFFTWKQIKEEMLLVISFLDSEGITFDKLELQQFISLKDTLNGEFHNIEIYDESEIEEFEDSLKFTKFEIIFSITHHNGRI